MNEKDTKIKNQIFEEGEKLYAINDKTLRCDERCKGLYQIENWEEMFFHLKEGKSKERFIELIKNSEYSGFLEGLNYEYGINNYPLNLEKAFQIYKDSANNKTDSMSMFRMYHIYKNDFNKFNIEKRNRILEKFYIFKCYSFLRYPIIDRDQNLCNRFNIPYEALIHFEEEDSNYSIFHNFIKFLNKNYKFYDINPSDLIIIESVIDYTLNNNEQYKNIAIKNLINLASQNNLEALYKLTCFQNNEKKEKEKEKGFKILFNQGYYRSYIDYALFLNKKKRYKESLEVLEIARKNGMIHAGFLYYDILLDSTNFSLLMNEAVNSSFSKESEVYKLINILIDDILTESVYSFFEFIFFRKIIVKHYNLEQQFNNYFFDFTKEMVEFLIKIAGGTNESEKKKTIKKFFCNDGYFQELHLALGTLYFYGIKNLINVDIMKSFRNIFLSYKFSESKSYKRFCYFYIYRIRKKIYEDNKQNQDNQNIFNIIKTDQDFKKTEKIIFDKYYSSINEDADILSSSYFYYLSRLYHKKIGNEGNKLLEYICLKRACEYKNNSPGAGSIISIYRRNKSKIIFEKYKNEYKEEFKNIIINNDSEGYGEDGTICPICFEYKRNKMALPCKHLFCEFCIEKLDRCPICRRPILLKYLIDSYN